MSSEGADSKDKGGFKAYTGALKYYLANTFMVATGDDPERDDRKPEEKKSEEKKPKELKASPKQVELINKAYQDKEKLKGLLEANGVDKVEDLPLEKASEICEKISEIVKKHEKGKEAGESDSTGKPAADDDARGD